MKFILLLLLSSITLLADDPPLPCDTCGTNQWGPPFVIPEGALAVGILPNDSSSWLIFATNTFVGETYEWQGADADFNWSSISQFQGSSNPVSSVISATNSYFRVHNLSYIYSTIGSVPGSGTCVGSYSGYGNYIKSVPEWGWSPDTNSFTIYKVSDGGGRSDVHIIALGNFGDNYCGYGSLILSNLPSRAYRFTAYFSNSPPTEPYPLLLSGFKP